MAEITAWELKRLTKTTNSGALPERGVPYGIIVGASEWRDHFWNVVGITASKDVWSFDMLRHRMRGWAWSLILFFPSICMLDWAERGAM